MPLHLQADFAPFVGKASLREQAADAAALAQAAFAGHVPEAPAGKGAHAEDVPNTSADADLALALQMQEVDCSCQGSIIFSGTSGVSCLASCTSTAGTPVSSERRCLCSNSAVPVPCVNATMVQG
jgi:hypothetical protein